MTGIITGISSGLFGIGGAVIITPILLYYLNMNILVTNFTVSTISLFNITSSMF